ncbi:MAG: BlaI/MecI/CopY family transcriptional regulator, partial [Bacteroides sp.]|nr:BlaI/MecI/CopY family transcriptional regulator [Bacteroides sp.]
QRSHIYSPTLDPGDVQTNILDHVLKTAFKGNTTKLVLSALGNKQTSPAEMEEIKAMIEEMEKKNHGNS